MRKLVLFSILFILSLCCKAQRDIYDLSGYWDKFRFGMSLSETISVLKEYTGFENEGFDIADNILSVYDFDFVGVYINSADFYFDDNDKLSGFHFINIYDEKEDATYALSRLKTIFDSKYTYTGQTNPSQSPYTDLVHEENWRDKNKRNIGVRINWVMNVADIEFPQKDMKEFSYILTVDYSRF